MSIRSQMVIDPLVKGLYAEMKKITKDLEHKSYSLPIVSRVFMSSAKLR
uniref:Uncharacterized protein n=1 Tax=Arundo donax TaxID=35708 RepID=A0A0A9GTA9_ARUDO